MNKDIDVELEQLEKFITAFQQMQEAVQTQFDSLKPAWDSCDESWKGAAKNRFTNGYESTVQSIQDVLNDGEASLDWLRSYRDIVREFED